MSWVPFHFMLMAFLLIPGLFLWKKFLIVMAIFFCFLSFSYLLASHINYKYRYPLTFFLFLFTEYTFFVSLFSSVVWDKVPFSCHISSWNELPLLGCLLLLSSSVSAMAYHSSLGFSRGGLFSSRFYLDLTVFLGVMFACVQIRELFVCECDFSYDSYYTSCFFVVGLHFLHVLLGLFCLSLLYRWGDSLLHHYYRAFILMYWHFVDYIWIGVYFFVYII